MGCGSSSQPSVSNPQHSIQQDTTHQHTTTKSDSQQTPNTPTYKPDKESSPIEDSTSSPQVPKAVKLEFNFKDGNTLTEPPERILKLKQESRHELTEQMIEERQSLAELRHQKQLESIKANLSKDNHKGKLRKEILAAQEFDKAQKQFVEIEKSLDTADSKRTKLLSEKITKIKLREKQAKQVRERAKKGDLFEDSSSFDLFEEPIRIEHDVSYNADTTDGNWSEMNDSSFLQPDPLEPDGPGSVITM